jgi:hypothetical protein
MSKNAQACKSTMKQVLNASWKATHGKWENVSKIPFIV